MYFFDVTKAQNVPSAWFLHYIPDTPLTLTHTSIHSCTDICPVLKTCEQTDKILNVNLNYIKLFLVLFLVLKLIKLMAFLSCPTYSENNYI